MNASPVLVYVRWIDSAIYEGGTFQPSDLNGPVMMESAGLLVSDDYDSVTLALDRNPASGDLRCLLCIPKINIEFRQELTPNLPKT